jgi:N-acetylglutamate synthase-like GNAT family acetyltransferase
MTTRPGKALRLKETTDFASMRQLALNSGLEDGAYSDFVKAYGFFNGEELVACAGLKMQGDVFLLECVAVKEELRGRGLGGKLVAALEEEAKKRGASKIWALARTPAFFEKAGYRKVRAGESEGPKLTACLSCRQYLRSCSPSIVLKVF